MILALIIINSCLSLAVYYGLQQYLVILVGQPIEVYLGITVVLITAKVAWAIYKIWPAIRRLLVKVDQLSSKVDSLSSRVNNPSPFGKGGQKRSLSTRVSQPLRTGGVSPVIGKSKDFSKSLYHSTLLKLRFNLENFQGMFTVKGGRPLVNILKGLLITAGARLTPSIIKYICHFIVTMRRLYRAQGVVGLTKFLKSAGVILQQSLGGHKIHDLGRLGPRVSRTRRGLPRFIPILIRERIRRDDFVAIRCTLTLINLFRVFEYVGSLSIKTITAPNKGHGGMDFKLHSFIPRFIRLFVFAQYTPQFIQKLLFNYSGKPVFGMFKGGPGVIGSLGQWNTMPMNLIRSGLGLMSSLALWDAFNGILNMLDYGQIKFAMKQLGHLKDRKIVVANQVAGEIPRYETGKTVPLVRPLSYLGKLGLKEEAAGKIRVFAMVDAWTQWVLHPFHEVIFDILRNIPMDGTFAQHEPLKRLANAKELYSLDLTAATDRLPLSLQKSLLGAIFGFEFAGYWANLLTYRTYRLHAKNFATDGKDYVDVRYAVGQPMGALSSWASLALTHHFIVQAAAWHAGFAKDRLYTNYAVLGDDIVIADHKVMTQYLVFMESLGVDIGLHKSLLSPQGLALEFAKRTIYKGVDVSPVPIKEFYSASRHLGSFVEFLKKYQLPFTKGLQAMGAGWKVRSWLNKPIGKLSSRVRLLILAVNLPTTQEEAIKFFRIGQAPVPQFKNETSLVIAKFMETEVKRITTKLMESCQVHLRDSNEYGKEEMQSHFLSEFGIPKGKTYREDKILLMDAITNMLNIIWHRAKITNIADAQILLKEIHALPKNDFIELYIGFLALNEKLALRSNTVFALERPQVSEVKGLLPPVQVRLWKRYSKLLQNSTNVISET
jgi:hypothetical protein